MDAMFTESYIETQQGEQFVGSIELQIRDIENDNIYIKKLTESDLCEITGIDKNFSSLEIIKVAEHIRRFTQPIELIVDDKTHLITNAMIKANSAEKPRNESVPKIKTSSQVQTTNKTANNSSPKGTNFGFVPEQAGKAMANRQQNKKQQT